jgi:hypothetical protein
VLALRHAGYTSYVRAVWEVDVIVTFPPGAHWAGEMYTMRTWVAAIATAVIVAALLPPGVTLASEIETLLVVPAVAMRRFTPEAPNWAWEIVSDAEAAAGVTMVPAVVGFHKVSAAIRRTSR